MVVLPRALEKAGAVVARAIKPELPDGEKSGTRALQSESAAKRFPTHMKDHVRRKLVSDATGVLKVIGVSAEAKHVNFDHGDKGKSVGRVHVLWGKALRKPPGGPLRKQLRDIPKIVEGKVEGRYERS